MSEQQIKEADEDIDSDEDGELDVEHYPLPAALLKAAGIESDDDFDELPEVAPK